MAHCIPWVQVFLGILTARQPFEAVTPMALITATAHAGQWPLAEEILRCTFSRPEPFQRLDTLLPTPPAPAAAAGSCYAAAPPPPQSPLRGQPIDWASQQCPQRDLRQPWCIGQSHSARPSLNCMSGTSASQDVRATTESASQLSFLPELLQQQSLDAVSVSPPAPPPNTAGSLRPLAAIMPLPVQCAESASSTLQSAGANLWSPRNGYEAPVAPDMFGMLDTLKAPPCAADAAVAALTEAFRAARQSGAPCAPLPVA